MTPEQAIEVLTSRYYSGVTRSRTDDEWRLATDTAIAALREKQQRQLDPATGLVPCGCGGEVYPHYQFGWSHGESCDYQAFEVSTGCDGCGTRTKPRYGHEGIDEDDTESASKRDWNTSHGYTEPPRPGAIGPDAGEKDPSGDEGAEL